MQPAPLLPNLWGCLLLLLPWLLPLGLLGYWLQHHQRKHQLDGSMSWI
jgi:hypothetical protein